MPSRDFATLTLGLGLVLVFLQLIRLHPTSSFAMGLERLGGRLAAFSYTLYLTHYPMLALWNQFCPKRYETMGGVSFLWYAAKIFSCLLVGWVFYLPFEARTSVVRKWLRNRLVESKRTPTLRSSSQTSP
jgi:peptidoglycan/LPS O-acetylase OafA/YrhL